MIDLAPYVDRKIRVKFVGGREVTGILKGADQICNLVLDEAIEILRGKFHFLPCLIDAKDPYVLSSETRKLGVMMARGPTVMAICNEEGFVEVENPYAEAGAD